MQNAPVVFRPKAKTVFPVEYSFPNLGLGHLIDFDTSQILPGFSLRTYDCNLDRLGGVAQRSGIKYIAENGACGMQIATFGEGVLWSGAGQQVTEESVTNTARTGGAANQLLLAVADPSTVTGEYVGRTVRITAGLGIGESKTITAHDIGTDTVTVNSNWTVHPDATSTYIIDPLIRTYAYSGIVLKSLRLIATAAQFRESTLAVALALGDDEEEYLPFWVYVHDKSKIDWGAGGIRVEVEKTVNVVLFRYSVPQASIHDAVADGNGWNMVMAQKKAFTKIGGATALDWNLITRIHVKLNTNAATFVTFYNWWNGVSHLYGLYNFKRSASKGGGNWYLAAGHGQVDVFVPEQRRWKPLITGLPRGKVVNFFTFRDFCYVVTGGARPRIIIDNNTAYLSGIDKPATQPTIAVTGPTNPLDLTMQVAAGTHTYAIVFYSTVTSRESDPTFTDPLQVVSAGSQVDLTNLPVSSDPKVTHLRIYRMAPGQLTYKRVSAELLGEVANGVTVYTDKTGSTVLGDDLEGDPNYDLNGVPPSARVAALVGNRAIYDDPANPGRIWVSRADTGEQVPLDGLVALDEGDNDDITGIADLWGYAGVFKSDSYYIGPDVGGSQPFAFQLRSKKIGSIGHRSIIISENVARFRHSTGYYEMDMSWQTRKISDGWDRPSLMPLSEPDLRQFDSSKGELVTAAFSTWRDQVMWTETLRPELFPSVLPVLHEPLADKSGWAFHRMLVSVIAPARDPDTNEEVILGGGRAGIVYRLDQNEIDDIHPDGNVAVDLDYMQLMEARERLLGIGSDVLKEYRYLDMNMRPGGVWPLDLTIYYDWDMIAAAKQFVSSLAPASAGAAIGISFTIGISAIGPQGGNYRRAVLPRGRHRTIAVRFRNNRIGEAPYISNYITWLTVRRRGPRIR